MQKVLYHCKCFEFHDTRLVFCTIEHAYLKYEVAMIVALLTVALKTVKKDKNIKQVKILQNRQPINQT